MFRFIKLTSEAQSAARWQASRGLNGAPGTALPQNMDTKTVKEIGDNQQLFRLAVHLYRAFEFHN